MNLGVFLVAAILLSLERIFYVWAWRWPGVFRDWCEQPALVSFGEPIVILQKCFYGFKGLQLAVFFTWCWLYGQGAPLFHSSTAGTIAVGGALILAGQVLNVGVFYRLGTVGVFYGCRFGHEVPWCREFPFSVLQHPQYVGTLLSIWGFFVAMRFPQDDWYLLPTLETLYYVMGIYFENDEQRTGGEGDQTTTEHPSYLAR
ncbi:MAG: methyltransferase [Candidatus Binatia bacterium]